MADADRPVIPLHKLQERTSLGVELHYLPPIQVDYVPLMEVHRDDHYIFMLHEKGHTRFIPDFEVADLHDLALFYILPGQVHHAVSTVEGAGWFMAVDTLLISEAYRYVFEEHVLHHQPIPLDSVRTDRLKKGLQLLYDQYNQTPASSFHHSIVHTLVASCVGMIAEAYLAYESPSDKTDARPVQLTRQFKKSLADQYKTVKSPAQYAEGLNVSLSYLNEAVKATTGFSVTYWIQQQIVLEAKRLLYYSQLTVKEVAFSLGYEDHTYFSRLFAKVVGCSPGQFRSRSRESSNPSR